MREGLLRDAGTVARWPLGMALSSWRYLWRITPLHRDDDEGAPEDVGPPLPEDLVDDRVQSVADGIGALFNRRYTVRIVEPEMDAAALLGEVAKDPNCPAPIEVAIFRKTVGGEGSLEVGDEYLVRMPGPWDGPVRVVERTPTSFRFVTLKGHLEAGQIEFRVRSEGDDLCFEIESWSRSGDRLTDLLYDRVRIAKEMQLHMWTHFCERAAALAGGRVEGGIVIRTRRLADPPLPHAHDGLLDAARGSSGGAEA